MVAGYLVGVDHEDVMLGGGPGALKVVDAGDAQVLVGGGHQAAQLADVLLGQPGGGHAAATVSLVPVNNARLCGDPNASKLRKNAGCVCVSCWTTTDVIHS